MTDVFTNPNFDNHEQVIFVHDNKADMFGIIAIHSTALGPAAGGCRMLPYKNINDALNDVLRLSQGMTMKNAVADLPLGGGKCVIIADPNSPLKKNRLKAMAKHIQRLAGQYWTAIDVGVSAEDADTMAEDCEYVFARASKNPVGFRPSQFTALGGFHAIRAAAQHLNGNDSLIGLKVAIQGVGATGSALAQHLVENGAHVTITDLNKITVRKIADRLNVPTVDPDDIYSVDADIFAPCALGSILNDDTIPKLKVRAVCGLANNQLEKPENGIQLQKRNILYVPDFVANAGGMMGASTVIFSKPDRKLALKKIEGIYSAVLDILDRSSRMKKTSSSIAEEIAIQRINSIQSEN